MSFLDNFRLAGEKEDFQTVSENIQDSIDFKGTNLWILMLAILIASLGLNVNSAAVIIGAMLISPLMGPIIGLGFGMAINDLAILKKSFFNYLFATAVGLATSTIFFVLSPLNEAHSEILARTAPSIYDVLIAFFGGLAGILAISSRLKGNVIPGVAIATALMPPLCTAGYGLATLQFPYFFGALYLFLINSVFIALATLATSRYLKFPYKQLPNRQDELKAKRIVWGVVLMTLLPSLYFGYDMVERIKFEKKAAQFIEIEAIFPNDYLIKKVIDAESKKITLTFGGDVIGEQEILRLKSKLPKYNLEGISLEIRQGFAYLKEDNDAQSNLLTLALTDKETEIQQLRHEIDSLVSQNELSQQLHKELKVQYPFIQSCILQTAIDYNDSTQQAVWLAIIRSSDKWEPTDQSQIEDWLKVRLQIQSLSIYFE